MPYSAGDDRGDGPLRLAPEMASFRALVLDFVRTYLTRWGQSPSYGEIAAGLDSNRTRVKRAVVSLEREGLLLRRKGTRGLALPDEIARARQLLERAGVLSGVTNPTLPGTPALDYPRDSEQAGGEQQHNGNSGHGAE